MPDKVIDGYSYAVIPATGFIAVRRPDGALRMLPGVGEEPTAVERAVRAFIEKDRGGADSGRD
ncbi:MAG: hypothetical protein QNJ92_02755 [Alphaproteobacteria bacterium]|nr:hypothetical protein [Alphaproteobacteria bacterium]